MTRCVSILAAVMFCHGLLAQSPIELPKISETVTVSIINVDVVVTDAAGQHVHGLTATDFVLTEDGKPQAITNFSEYGAKAASLRAETAGQGVAAPPPAVVVPRNVVVFIDTGSIQATHRGRLFRALKEFLKASVRTSDQAMVVTWNRRFKIEAPPTNDFAKLERVLNRVAIQAPNSLMIEYAPAISAMGGGDSGPALAQESMERRRRSRVTALEVQQSVRALNVVLTRMAGVEGRKALLLVSEGFVIPSLDPSATVDEFAADNLALIDSVINTANASGVTMYTFHAAGAVPVFSAADSSAAAAGSRTTQASDSVTALRSMAGSTGGLIAEGRDDFRGAFAKVAADFDAYYSIGYRAAADRAGRERHIGVRTTDGRYRVRARKTFIERSSETEMKNLVVSNLFFGSRRNQLGIAARLGEPKKTRRGNVVVPLEIAIPLTALTLLPVGDKYAGGFFVYLAVSDANNAMSDVVRRAHRVSFPAADLSKASGSFYTYAIDVETARGNRLSIGVLDEISATTGFATVKVPKGRLK